MRELSEIKRLFPLQGDQVKLSLFEPNHLTEDYVAWLNNPEVMKYSNQRFKLHTLDSCRQYCESFQSIDGLFLSIYYQKLDVRIGTISVYFNRPHQTADIGIMIGDLQCQGLGLGKDAWLTIMSFLLKIAEVRKVTGGTLSCNYGMINVMESTGMEADGVRSQQELVDGFPYDIVHYARYS